MFCFFLLSGTSGTGRNGEEAIPMLMLNHSDKPGGEGGPGPPRGPPLPPPVARDRSPPKLLEAAMPPLPGQTQSKANEAGANGKILILSTLTLIIVRRPFFGYRSECFNTLTLVSLSNGIFF